MKHPDPTGPLLATANVQAAKTVQRAAPVEDALPNPELPDFRALSRDALAANILGLLAQREGAAPIDDGGLALLSVTGGAAAADRHDSHASAAGASADRNDARADDLTASGPNAGQLMAAAHTVAVYLLAGSAALLNAAAETLAPRAERAPDSLSIRIAYLTPEGGHAAIGLTHPDLGELGIEISLNARALSVIATAETERSAAAIREGQGALANRLAAQNINLQSLTVVVVDRRPNDRHSRKKREG